MEGMVSGIADFDDADAAAGNLVSFGYLENVAWGGFDHGWQSDEYVEAIEEADRLVGLLLRAIEANPLLANNTVLVVTSGNGINDRGGFNVETVMVPWMAWGNGVRENYEIVGTPVRTMDTTPTLLWAMNVTQFPASFIGQPITEAFV